MRTLTVLTSVIQAAQRVKRAALARVVDSYSYVLQKLPCNGTTRFEDAVDLVQEVFVSVVRTIGSYEDDGRYDGWLFGIAANLQRDRAK